MLGMDGPFIGVYAFTAGTWSGCAHAHGLTGRGAGGVTACAGASDDALASRSPGCVLIRENDCQFSVELGTGAETDRRGYGEALASVALVRSGSGTGGGSDADAVAASDSAGSVHEDSRSAVVAMAWARSRMRSALPD